MSIAEYYKTKKEDAIVSYYSKKKTREVNELLGKNQTKDHEEIYKYIKEELKITEKKCSSGCSKKGNKFNISHKGDRMCPITDFRLNGIRKVNGEIVCEKNVPLQGQCMRCDTLWRKARSVHSTKKNTGGHQQYINKYGDTKKCSVCKNELNCMDFNLSPSMECGLHNVCKECSKTYGESLGDRWIIYLPDGKFKYKKEKGQHDDHIFPLVLGGSNEEINHQLITAKENLEKSCSLLFNNVNEIDEQLLSKRWRHILVKCKEEDTNLQVLECRLRKAIHTEINQRKKLTDTELKKQFEDYNKKWNLRKGVDRAVSKLRNYK
jgi:hypothetical protein